MLTQAMRAICSSLVLLAVLSAPAVACQIPVFRYALENWLPEPYLLIIAHRGELSLADKKLLSELELAVDQVRGKLNLDLKVVDLSQTKEPVLETVLGENIKSIQAPQMVLLYPFDLPSPPDAGVDAVAPAVAPSVEGLTAVPRGPTSTVPNLTQALPPSAACADGKCGLQSGLPRLAWRGDLTAAHIRQLASSPARQEIVRRLLDGHSAVWVLLESGDKAQDDVAAATLEKALSAMQREIQLPDRQALESDEHYKPGTKIDLKIAFSVVRIPHEWKSDAIFATTLLNSDPSLAEKTGPVAVSIFGRGRAFSTLSGKNIGAEQVATTCRYLTGDCSCQIKEENPGVDLLFAVAWNDKIQKTVSPDQPLPAPSGIGAFAVLQAATQGKSASTPPTTAKEAAAVKSEAKAVKSEAAVKPAAAARPGAQRTAQATATESNAAAPLASSAMSFSWIVGPALLGLIAILAGTLWLRHGQRTG